MIGGAKGIGIGIDFGIPNQYCRATSKPYIEKDVLDSLRVVTSAYGKSNDDADRSIVKNLVDASNPFVISNAAFKLNSGFGKYEQDFTDWKKSPKVTSFDSESIKFTSDVSWVLLYHPSSIGEDIPSFKVRIKLYGKGTLYYNYITQEGTYTNVAVKSEIFETPICYNTKYTGEKEVNVGFTLGVVSGECSGTITQIPSFEGAFVTDGIDDLITSTKTVQEMLGGSTEFTAVSMIHLISPGQDVDGAAYTNYIRTSDNYWTSNRVSNVDKTGIYGYSFKQSTPTVINNILGDKGDYTTDKSPDTSEMFRANFSVEGFKHAISGTVHASSVAWYWTIIANKVLTTDQINQVIAYFNLDRTLNPDILCNTIKQGITNENHAEFGDKLIDFSGNGRDIQLNNIAWKGDSGIGKYETELSNTSIWTQSKETTCSPFSSSYNGLSGWIVFANTELTNSADMPSFKIQVKGLLEGQELIYRYYDSNGQSNVYSMGKDGEYTLPSDVRTAKPQTSNTSGFQVVKNETNIITITQIPSHVGALYLDGVSDFGKVTGMPIYKDYTFIIDRQIISIGDTAGVVASKFEDSTDVNKQGAFLFEYLGAPNNISAWSFYKDNGKVANTDFTRGISYQSTYSYNGKDLTIGTSKDSDKLWLGTIRDNDSRFFNGAIYSLMSFPYSMSEFLIERQLKKHKLGTLYPNMVEFRPVIKSSVELVNKPSFAIRGISTLLNAGDYIPENSEIWVVITMNNVADRITKFVINGNTIDIPSSAYNPSTMKYGFPFTIDSKSPQKITMTIEQDENYVQWNPVVESNAEYSIEYFLSNSSVPIIGDYYSIGTEMRFRIKPINSADEIKEVTVYGHKLEHSGIDNAGRFIYVFALTSESPQKINITIDEYIRFEDIVQPYPSLFTLIDYDTEEVYSWGSKLKVGARFKGNVVNLLPNMYEWQGDVLYNGEVLNWGINPGVVAKEMVFSWNMPFKYLIDNNEPKCILSPRLLRIPNSSYKILGYIPDISGHGNHGKINNSAYAGMSGVNGYPVVFGANKTFANESNGYVTSITSNTIHITNVLNAGLALLYSYVKYNGNLQNIKEIPPFKIEIKGLEGRSKFIYKYLATSDATKETNLYLGNGTHELPKSFLPTEALINDAVVGFSISPIEEGVTNFLSDITIKVLPEYEGAYCLDGVDDFVTIPTIVGGKQVLMKMNWQNRTGLLYDQRKNGSSIDAFAILNVNSNNSIAYNSRNTDGETYIDGILNKNIVCPQLYKITHSITIINQLANKEEVISPTIGSDTTHKIYFSQMSLYDFMLFDDISTEDKIKELNEYVGIEAKVELPPYYWDTYGKTNFDADRDTIQQRGIAVGDYDLINYNHAYEGMSGYNGYPIILSGTNRTYQDKASYVNVVGDDKNVINLTRISFNTAAIFSYVKQNGELTSYNKDIESFKIKVTGIDYSRFVIKYSYISEANATTKTTMTIASDSIYELPKSFASDGSLTSSDIWIGINFTKQSADIPGIIEDVNVTIEVLPEYENGLVYDGVEDFSDNKNVPIIDDFTVIAKRTWLEENISDKPFIIKGDTLYPDGNQNAFLFEYGKLSTYSFGQNNKYDESVVPSLISWATPTSYNGTTSLVRGSAIDTVGIDIAHATKMVLYKLILYPKTISLLEINFLKNLMEKDEIIDLTNPIFIQ